MPLYYRKLGTIRAAKAPVFKCSDKLAMLYNV
jgi:hypothetical protein